MLTDYTTMIKSITVHLMKDYNQGEQRDKDGRWTRGGAEAHVLTFGKHTGKPLGQVHRSHPSYVSWLASDDFQPSRPSAAATKEAAQLLTGTGSPVPTQKPTPVVPTATPPLPGTVNSPPTKYRRVQLLEDVTNKLPQYPNLHGLVPSIPYTTPGGETLFGLATPETHMEGNPRYIPSSFFVVSSSLQPDERVPLPTESVWKIERTFYRGGIRNSRTTLGQNVTLDEALQAGNDLLNNPDYAMMASSELSNSAYTIRRKKMGWKYDSEKQEFVGPPPNEGLAGHAQAADDLAHHLSGVAKRGRVARPTSDLGTMQKSTESPTNFASHSARFYGFARGMQNQAIHEYAPHESTLQAATPHHASYNEGYKRGQLMHGLRHELGGRGVPAGTMHTLFTVAMAESGHHYKPDSKRSSTAADAAHHALVSHTAGMMHGFHDAEAAHTSSTTASHYLPNAKRNQQTPSHMLIGKMKSTVIHTDPATASAVYKPVKKEVGLAMESTFRRHAGYSKS